MVLADGSDDDGDYASFARLVQSAARNDRYARATTVSGIRLLAHELTDAFAPRHCATVYRHLKHCGSQCTSDLSGLRFLLEVAREVERTEQYRPPLVHPAQLEVAAHLRHTLNPIQMQCATCGRFTVVQYEEQTRSADEALALRSYCTSCARICQVALVPRVCAPLSDG